MATTSLPPSQATYISYGAPNNNYNDNDWLRAGVQSTTSIQYQTLIQFDVSIPPGSTIDSAVMRLYSYSDECYSYETTLLAKRNISGFTASSVTYATRPSTTDTGYGSCTASGYNTWYEWDIKSIVQAWQSGAANYGLTIVQSGTTTQRGKCFKKSGTYQPQLVIAYSEPTAPGPATGLHIEPSTFMNEAAFHWTPGTNGTNNPITGYDVYCRQNAGGPQFLGNTSSTSWPMNTSGIAPGTQLSFRVDACSNYKLPVASDYSNPGTKNRAPNAPTGVAMSKPVYVPGEMARVTFTSAGDPDNNLKGFEVETSGSATTSKNESSTASYVEVDTTGWTPGVSYSFRVRAYDTLGACSAWSLPMSALVGLPMKLFATEGSTYKQVAQMKLYTTQGSEPKTVKSMKIAVTEGSNFKTVF